MGPAQASIERDVRPRGAYRFPPLGRDGLVRRRGDGVVRLLHHGGQPVVVGVRPVSGAVRLYARGPSRAAAAWGIDRMRFALALDHDPLPFQRRFVRDPLIGSVIHRRPWIRPWRSPEPYQALAWAVCEQLIESVRAAAIQRRLVWRYGRVSECATLRDAPLAEALAARAPAELQACDLSAGRAVALVKVSREVARGSADLEQEEPTWRRLRRIAGIGSWTLEKLAFHGQGRDDQLPAGDLAYVKLVGALARLGRRASEDEVREFFAPYAPYQALAGLYALRAPRPAVARW